MLKITRVSAKLIDSLIRSNGKKRTMHTTFICKGDSYFWALNKRPFVSNENNNGRVEVRCNWQNVNCATHILLLCVSSNEYTPCIEKEPPRFTQKWNRNIKKNIGERIAFDRSGLQSRHRLMHTFHIIWQQTTFTQCFMLWNQVEMVFQ